MSDELRKSLVIGGTRYALAVGQAGDGPPSEDTPGKVGVTYLDKEAKPPVLYACTAAVRDGERIRCSWVRVGGAGEDSGQNVDPVSNLIALSGEYKGIDLRGFMGKIFALKANAENKLTVPTPDGQNQPTHPKVLHFPDRWNGYKFWMAFTPWTNQNNNTENPCICYSDDGETWSAEGITNPLAEPPTEDGAIVGYNSDVHIVMVGDVMECWWRVHFQSGSRKGWLTINRRTSTDGINWTAAEELHETNEVVSNLSPVVIHEDGVYKIWLCYGYTKLVYFESADGTNWQFIRDISVDLADKPDYKIWHFDIIHSEHGYEFVGCYNPRDTTKNLYIYYARSGDNITYTTPYMVLTTGKTGQFDSGELYRPSIVRVGNGMMLYYGARQEGTRIWGIGKLDATSPEALRDILIQSGEATAPDATEYSITRNLTNVVSSNVIGKVEQGAAYSTVLSALSGYAIDSVTITMGGVDITAAAYSGGNVTISAVTGDIVITARASAITVEIPCTGISLSASSLEFTDYAAQTLTATVEPSNTTDAVQWSVSHAGIVTVNSGIVTPVADGNCTVTAACGAQSASCTVTVALPAAAEPIAAYLASSPGNVDGEWQDTKGGASIDLHGGTFADGAYQTDGVDDYAVLPLTNAKTVRLRTKNNTGIKYGGTAATVPNAYYFDTRAAGTTYMLNYSARDWADGTDATYYVDDTLVELGAYGAQVYMVAEQWQTITIIFNDAFTGDMRLFCSNKNIDYMAAELEYVKVYDTAVTP